MLFVLYTTQVIHVHLIFSHAFSVTLSKMTHFALVIQSRQSHAFAGLKS